MLTCKNPRCAISFCYYCQAPWHPNLTCEENWVVLEGTGQALNRNSLRGTASAPAATAAASTAAAPSLPIVESSALQVCAPTSNLKPCPRCKTLIDKVDDGTCNHVVCSQCSMSFCWLCLREVNDLHYFSPSGCTLYGKKTWNTPTTVAVQVAFALLAPAGIGLIAAVCCVSLCFFFSVVIK